MRLNLKPPPNGPGPDRSRGPAPRAPELIIVASPSPVATTRPHPNRNCHTCRQQRPRHASAHHCHVTESCFPIFRTVAHGGWKNGTHRGKAYTNTTPVFLFSVASLGRPRPDQTLSGGQVGTENRVRQGRQEPTRPPAGSGALCIRLCGRNCGCGHDFLLGWRLSESRSVRNVHMSLTEVGFGTAHNAELYSCTPLDGVDSRIRNNPHRVAACMAVRLCLAATLLLLAY